MRLLRIVRLRQVYKLSHTADFLQHWQTYGRSPRFGKCTIFRSQSLAQRSGHSFKATPLQVSVFVSLIPRADETCFPHETCFLVVKWAVGLAKSQIKATAQRQSEQFSPEDAVEREANLRLISCAGVVPYNETGCLPHSSQGCCLDSQLR